MSEVSPLAVGVLAPLIIDTFTQTVEMGIQSAIRQLPGVAGAVVTLLVGYVLGSQLEPIVADLGDRVGIDDRIAASWIAPLFDEMPAGASRALGAIVKYYVFLFAAFVAADIAAFQQLTPYLETLVVAVPNVLAGVAIILIGIAVTDYAVGQTRNATVVEESAVGHWIPAAVRALLSAIVVIIGLDMIGINLKIVYLIAEGVSAALGLGIVTALALGLGVAAGLLARDYLDQIDTAENAAGN